MQHRLVHKRFAHVNVPTLIYCYIVNGAEYIFLTNSYNEIHWYFLSTRRKDNDSAAHKDGNIKPASSMNR